MGLGGRDGPALLGFDFPIGLPRAYAARVGIAGYVDWLRSLPEEAPLLKVAAQIDQVSLARPFFPELITAKSPGIKARFHQALGFGAAELMRRCERAHCTRKAASEVFWCLGAGAVGKATVAAWRDTLGPALRQFGENGSRSFPGIRAGARPAIAPAAGDASGAVRTTHDAVEQRGDPGTQCGKLALDDIPYEHEINAEVFVDQLVAHPCDLPPRDRVIARSGFRCKALDRLTEYLDVADDRVLGLAIGKERVAAVLAVLHDGVDRVERAQEVGALAVHRAIASDRISSRR